MQVSGLCGNFDGNAINDHTTMGGVDVSSDPDADNLVGDSFIDASETLVFFMFCFWKIANKIFKICLKQYFFRPEFLTQIQRV